MRFEEATRLTLVFFVAGWLSYLLVRLFAWASAKRGANVLSTLDRAGALGSGPIQGSREVAADNLRVLRLVLRHTPVRELELLRLLAWLSLAVTADLFLVLAGLGAGSFWLVLGGLLFCFWVLEVILAISRHDAGRAWRAGIVAGLILLGIVTVGSLSR